MVSSSKPRVFVASSSEQLLVAQEIRAQLKQVAEVTVWNEGEFSPGQTVFERLDEIASESDFAVLVMNADDVVEVRSEASPATRDNVLFEAGFFMSRLGRERAILVYDATRSPRIATDLGGLLAATYHGARSDENTLAAVGEACDPIRRRIRALGRRAGGDRGATDGAPPPPRPEPEPEPGPGPGASAFPIGSPARLVYTCRSIFSPSFDCPAPLPCETRAVGMHAAVDELETVALVLARSGAAILGSDELAAAGNVLCSARARALLAYSPEDPATSIHPALLDDLVVVGENAFSNRLLALVAYPLPWRYLVHQTKDVCRPSLAQYEVRIVFKESRGAHLPAECAVRLSDPATRWGLSTCVRNPFAPDRRLLLLIGCRRPGQYALLRWLRGEAGAGTSAPLPTLPTVQAPGGSERRDDGARQIAVWAEPKDNYQVTNRILREWRVTDDGHVRDGCQAVDVRPGEAPQPAANAGDEISDVSLVARVAPDEAWLRAAIASLPDDLRRLARRGEDDDTGSFGPHVTLFEFFHHVGRDPTLMAVMQRAARHMTSPGAAFLERLRRLLGTLPPVHFTARQAQVTRYSLRVLGDLYMDRDDFEAAWSARDHQALCAMDLVADVCADALRVDRAAHPDAPAFPPFRMPFPLHLTVARLPADDGRLRDQAEDWARAHRLHVWGRSRDLKLVVTRAERAPFNDVQAVTVR